MKRLIILLLLAITVAVTGCTTQSQLDQQTKEINQHTTDVVQQENRPITKIRLLSVDAETNCVAYDRDDAAVALGEAAADVRHVDRMQQFQNGRTIVLNGLDEIRHEDCTDLEARARNRSDPVVQVEEELRVNSVRYNKTVYQEGRPVTSQIETCRMYRHYEDEWNSAKAVEELYSECFDIEDAMKVIGR